jgi:transcription-repair coupling factor (superfamily II helicase)
LYTNLLKDAIDRARGEAPTERSPVTVDLPFDVLIPESYVTDERERLYLYRRLALIADEEQVDALVQELKDRFGTAPPAIENLIDQVKLKLLAESAGVISIVLRADHLTMKGEKRMLWDRLGLYKQFGMNAKVEANTLRVDAHALGKDWLPAVRDILIGTAAFRGSAPVAGSDQAEAKPAVTAESVT